MSDRDTQLEKYADTMMSELGLAGKFERGLIINAADHATAQIRSCGGACLDCSSLSRIVGEPLRVCDMLESEGVTVYREPSRMPMSMGYDSFGRGTAY